MSFKGKKHSKETKNKIAKSQKARYNAMSDEKKQERIEKIKKTWEENKAIIKAERERQAKERYKEYIKNEYNRLFKNVI